MGSVQRGDLKVVFFRVDLCGWGGVEGGGERKGVGVLDGRDGRGGGCEAGEGQAGEGQAGWTEEKAERHVGWVVALDRSK